jgi:hypothetical protein
MFRKLLVGACALSLAAPAAAATVGPNTYGYVGHPTAYDFVSGIPTSVNLALSGSYDAEVSVALPWAFPWHGSTYSTINVGSTGGISFTPGTELGWTNSCLPAYGTSSSDGAPDIAPFWDNVQPVEGGSVYAWEDAANGRFIVSWEGVPHTSGGVQRSQLPGAPVSIGGGPVPLRGHHLRQQQLRRWVLRHGRYPGRRERQLRPPAVVLQLRCALPGPGPVVPRVR